MTTTEPDPYPHLPALLRVREPGTDMSKPLLAETEELPVATAWLCLHRETPASEAALGYDFYPEVATTGTAFICPYGIRWCVPIEAEKYLLDALLDAAWGAARLLLAEAPEAFWRQDPRSCRDASRWQRATNAAHAISRMAKAV